MAFGLVAVIALAACGRSSANNGPSLATLVAASVQLTDVQPNLDDPSNWWAGPPTFGARPLDISQRDDNNLVYFMQRFTHVGSAEALTVRYDVWSSTSIATAIVSSTQQIAPSPSTAPGAGDQAFYFNQNLRFGAAPYMTRGFVRLGQTVVEVRLTQSSSFVSSSTMSKVVKTVASHLKNAISHSSRSAASASPAYGLLPPESSDMGLLGSTTLPVGAVAAMTGDPAPTDMEAMFEKLGAKDFAYGDYVLFGDTHMEVQTAGFTFSGSTGGADWLDSFIGKANLDQNGDYLNYDQVTQQYIGAVAAGSHGALMICRSVADFEAASRACESPMVRVLGAWKGALASS